LTKHRDEWLARMAVTVPFDLTYEFDVRADIDEVFGVLSHVPTSAGFFPKVDRLVSLGDNSFRWELQKVGTAQVNIQTIYTSKYTADPKKHTVTWVPVPEGGNGRVGGSWTLSRRKGATHIVLRIVGEIVMPLPALAKLLVVPVVSGEHQKLIEKYIANLVQRFGGAA
jgi:carbon monoxide dehydrogenase subunit G